MRAGFGVEELDCVICPTEEEELAAIIEVNGGVVCAWWCFEEACWSEGGDHLGYARDIAHIDLTYRAGCWNKDIKCVIQAEVTDRSQPSPMSLLFALWLF